MLIIPKKTPAVETHWQKELANSFTTLQSLLDYLEINPCSIPSALDIEHPNASNKGPLTQVLNPSEELASHEQARTLFPMRVPKPFAALMQKGNWQDPLLQQVVPQNAEFIDRPGFVIDPLQEQGSSTPGLIHKYQSRILLIVRGGCAVNCRYCFRRHFPYQEHHLGQAQYQEALNYVKQDTRINEVIFSGGDPLMANDQQILRLAKQVDEIPHVKRLRIHTRLPVVIPARVSDDLLVGLSTLRIKPIMVLHVNHKNEIGEHLQRKAQALRRAGVSLLNQSVLLKGVNDNADSICDLSEALFDADIMPYYLHMFDPVKGASHFDVSKAQAKAIMAECIKRLPGFLVPKLVQELPGQPGKTPIDLGLEP